MSQARHGLLLSGSAYLVWIDEKASESPFARSAPVLASCRHQKKTSRLGLLAESLPSQGSSSTARDFYIGRHAPQMPPAKTQNLPGY
mmetsp:Transcript_49685/g.82631  ORF Transcript_49685/g.82631 Transcript_49685/m.82631 type:complete len:87 (+) Transcript_49685:1175-1435(+)